jgi:thiamine biosynthesis protein ThiS
MKKEITINGKKHNVSSKTLNELFQELKINTVGRLVSINGNMKKWSEYDKEKINEKDQIEIIGFIGGG